MENNEKKYKADNVIVPALRLYHPTADGKGAALSVRVIPATVQQNGCVQMEFASQSGVGDGRNTFARFDWAHRGIIRLNYAEVFEFSCALADATPSFVKETVTPKWQAVLSCNAVKDGGVELSLKFKGGESPQREIGLTLSRGEAMGMGVALKSAMGRICFG